MRRRDFLLLASGAAGATAAGASGAAVAQEDGTATPNGNGDGTETPSEDGGGDEGEDGGEAEGDGGGGGGTETVALVDYAFEPGTDQPLYIMPDTTVTFVWETSTHNIVVDSQPDGANWEGYEDIEDAGFEYEHTFTELGDYEFHCQPHLGQGMEGTIIVNEEGAPPEGGGGAESDPEHMGVPIQAHWVGTATLLSIFASLVFTFFFLKYGETPHTGYPEER